MRELKLKTKVLISFDDTGHGRLHSDISVNPLYYPTKQLLKCSYIGPEFQIIRPKFYEHTSAWHPIVKNIIVCQGGADAHDLTPLIVNSIIPLLTEFDQCNLHVLVGYGSNFEAVTELSKNFSGRCFIHHAVTDMPLLLSIMDIAISSGGVLPFELASIGCPLIMVTKEHKEIRTCLELEKSGVGVFIDIHSDDFASKLVSYLKLLICNPFIRRKYRDNCLVKFGKPFGGQLIEIVEKHL
jgi:spore coat polysaccharide biosynthesis predicted glycosyltransferase SpsG